MESLNFISTQIQGKIDDLETEQERQGKLKKLREDFSNAGAPAVKVSELLGEPKKSRTKPQPKPKPKAKPKPKPKPKKKDKRERIKSISEHVLKKLSGKPQKLKLRKGCRGSEASTEFAEDNLFTESEWRRMKSRIRVRKFESQNTSSALVLRSGRKESLWDAATVNEEVCGEPKQFSELSGLYDDQNGDEIDEYLPVTLSQICKWRDNDVNDNDDDYNEYNDRGDGFSDEISCSSAEGSVICVPDKAAESEEMHFFSDSENEFIPNSSVNYDDNDEIRQLLMQFKQDNR